MAHDARIIVIAGLPGAGKSTLSRRLAQHFEWVVLARLSTSDTIRP